MPTRIRGIAPLTFILVIVPVALGCRGRQGEDGARESAAAGTGAAGGTGAPPVTGLPPRRLDSIRLPHVDPPRPAVGPLVESGAEPRAATVREIVESDALVGQRVRVGGRCLGRGSGRAAGPAPVSGTDWVLEGDGAAVWVNGALPPGCTASGASSEPVTVVAVVRQDTIPAAGGTPARTRRYLVRE